jgi:enoyl-CoA hydratase/carnithine racemase
MSDFGKLVIIETIVGANPNNQICSIKLNRPQAINALNYEMVSVIKNALMAGLSDKNLKCATVC